MDTEVVRKIDECLSRISDQMGGFCPEDMSVLDRMTEAFDELIETSKDVGPNSLNHGIESASDRTGLGKPASANVWLRAYHKGGYLIIEIEDDGKGLDKERILEKAESKGLISGESACTWSRRESSRWYLPDRALKGLHLITIMISKGSAGHCVRFLSAIASILEKKEPGSI